MSETKIFPGSTGLPTSAEVHLFFEHFGIPQAGTLLTHAAIEACIGARWKSTRYRTILDVIRRKLMKDHNVDVSIKPGEGMMILTSPERITASRDDFKGAVRKTRKAAVRSRVIPDEGLNAQQRAERDHVQAVTARMFMVAANETKALRRPPEDPPAPVPALPRPTLPKTPAHGAAST